MKNFAVLSALLLSSVNVFAHIEEGRWVGTTAQGAACEMNVGAQTFINNFAHPLNERIALTISEYNFSVQHPAVVSFEDSVAKFNHDVFESVIAIPQGAVALQIKMKHAEDFEGPTEFTIVKHVWTSSAGEKTVCSNLQHIK